MKDDITRNVFANICEDFKEVLIVGIEESKEQFSYSIACIDFIYNLKEQGINTTLNSFSENIRCELYEECKRYLAR